MAVGFAHCLCVLLLPLIFGNAAARLLRNADTASLKAPGTDSILLTEGTLQSIGFSIASQPQGESVESNVANVAPASQTGGLLNVCEHTRAALFAEAPSESAPSQILGGPVYRACTETLAPLHEGSEDGSAVKVLNECMVIVDTLLTRLGSSRSSSGSADTASDSHVCQEVVDDVQGRTSTPKPEPEKLSVSAAPVQVDAVSMVAQAVVDACPETLQEMEVNLKTEEDTMRLGNAVAPVCEQKAGALLKTAGVTGESSESALKKWCRQLDGRLTLAMEIGFFYALHPDVAERQAARSNPYATATRRQFCERFSGAVHAQAIAEQAGTEVSTKTDSAEAKSTPAQAKPTPAAVGSTQSAIAKAFADSMAHTVNMAASTTAAPATVALVTAAPAASKVPEHNKPAVQQNVSAVPAGEEGLDIIHLLQAISKHGEWNSTCTALVSRLSSHEGSVMQETTLGAVETTNGADVLTFNADDQAQVKTCSAHLKVVAIEAGLLKNAEMQSAVSLLGKRDQIEELMDSPWAEDACNDIAHSFLSARLVHPTTINEDEFCSTYTRDLQALQTHDAEQAKTQAMQDLQALKRRGAEKAMMKVQQAMASEKPVMALAAQKANLAAASTTAAPPSEDDSLVDTEGADFWGGMTNQA